VEIIDQFFSYVYRGARAVVWENFKDNPFFDISTEHPTTYYKDMQRAVFCLCPLGWAPLSPRLVEAVIFGRILVIIGDDIVLPFADAIPWEEIGEFIDEKDVPNPSVGFNFSSYRAQDEKNSRREEELEEDDIIDFRILLIEIEFYLEKKTIQNLKIA